MSDNSLQDQNEEEFKDYLDKIGVLEFFNTNVPQNQKNKEFKEFLNKAGVPEFIDSVLIKLYKEPNKPSDALEYIKKSLGSVKADTEEIAKLSYDNNELIAKLSYDNNELKKRIEKLEKIEAELKEKLEVTTLKASKTIDEIEEMGATDAPANNAVITHAANVDAAEVSATALHEPPNIDSLPKELLETLFSKLPPRDLKSVVQVCKRWNITGEGPHLWSGLNLVVSKLADMPDLRLRHVMPLRDFMSVVQVCKHLRSGVNLLVSNLADMPEILGLSRLTKLKQLTLMDISKEMLKAIENHEGLKTLKLIDCNVSEINSDLLARVLTKMEEIHMNLPSLNKNQWNAFFNSMSDDTKLKKLEIVNFQKFGRSLTEANPQSLAEAVSKLEMFELDGFQLTSEQSKAMFKQLAIKSKLKSLKIMFVDLSSVDEPSLVTALIQLEEAALCSTLLNARQCTAIIGLVAAGNSKLKVLRLLFNNLKYVNPSDMGKAVGNLEIIDLDSTQLTNEQFKEIFKYARGDSNLKSVNIGHNDLRSVEPASLAITVSKMEKCYLKASKLTSPQLEAIFKQLNEDDCKLKELDLSWVSLSTVDEEVLSNGIANLVEVDLSYTQLTTQQLEALFMKIKAGRKLKILKLRVKDLRSVKIDSLVGALGCLEEVHLRRDLLTPEQRDAVWPMANVFMDD